MNKIWRNRAILAILMAAIALVIYGAQYFELVDLLPTGQAEVWDPVGAGNRIEEATGVDVLRIGPIGGYPKREEIAPLVIKLAEGYFNKDQVDEDTTFVDLGANEGIKAEFAKLVEEGVEATTRYGGYILTSALKQDIHTVGDLIDYVTEHFSGNAGMLGATPTFHVAIVWEKPDPDYSGYAVAIVGYEDGDPVYKILENDEYAWKESEAHDEDVRLRWNYWTLEKWEWYAKHGKGFFPPGKYSQASLAMRHLIDHVQIKEVWAPLINAIMKEAFYYEEITGERFWNLIEIDYLHLSPLRMAPGVGTDGKPNYIAYREPVLMGSRYIARAWSSVERISEYHVYKVKRYRLDYVFGPYGPGALTVDEVKDLLTDDWKSAYLPGVTMMGPIPYQHGFNHPWMHKDMST